MVPGTPRNMSEDNESLKLEGEPRPLMSSLPMIDTGNSVVLVLLCVMILIVGTVGNSVVLYTFGWRKRKSMNNSKALLLTLGIFDLICSALIPVLMIVRTVGPQAAAFDAGCRVLPLALTSSVTASQVMIIAICYDRYVAVRHPFRNRPMIPLIKKTVTASILLSTVLCIPMFVDLMKHSFIEAFYCYRSFEKSRSFLLQSCVFLARDVNTFIAMAFYIRGILRELGRTTDKLPPSSAQQCIRWRKRREHIKRLLAAVVTTFKLCIAPFDLYIFFLMTFDFQDPGPNSWQKIVTGGSYLIVLQSANSAVNVFIYSAFHPDFTFLRVMSRRLSISFSS
uniref:Neuropeptide-like GPCR n=1 Tax=Tripedalia cystophora TaxID=6141 RepID=A0A481ZMR6_TRICY|nr:neuropeptide-like GPCR [Tripedalia cystophora]